MASGDEDDPIIEEVSPQLQMNLAEMVDYKAHTNAKNPQVHQNSWFIVYVFRLTFTSPKALQINCTFSR